MKNISLSIPYNNLKQLHRQIRDSQPEQNRVRIHRAISWLNNFEHIGEIDIVLIRLWISFNAAYAGDFGDIQSERVKLKSFLAKIIELDNEKKIRKALFDKFSGPIRTLIDNKFSFEPFWKAVRTHDSSEKWNEMFLNHKKRALSVLMSGDALSLLEIIFDRIYTLRNQIIHGGATFGSQINRNQLEDACQILAEIIPLMITLMIKNPTVDFGEINYPVI